MKFSNSQVFLMMMIVNILVYIANLEAFNYIEVPLLNLFPTYFIKIWGIFINYNLLLATIVIILSIYIPFKNKKRVNLNYCTLIPVIVSIFSSIFFIVGVGNIINKLYKRALIQFIIGLCLDFMHFYMVINRWNLDITIYFNSRLWTISLILLIYMVYVIYDTYQCTISKYYDEPYPKFLGVRIDE